MYSVTVRDHFMIAHSLQGEVFGPAQRLHGATYVVDATFYRSELDPNGVVVDIGQAANQLASVLGDLDYRNLDEESVFEGKNTTTEFLARLIFERLAGAVRAGRIGDEAKGVSSIRVSLKESHIARAGYEGDV